MCFAAISWPSRGPTHRHFSRPSAQALILAPCACRRRAVGGALMATDWRARCARPGGDATLHGCASLLAWRRQHGPHGTSERHVLLSNAPVAPGFVVAPLTAIVGWGGPKATRPSCGRVRENRVNNSAASHGHHVPINILQPTIQHQHARVGRYLHQAKGGQRLELCVTAARVAEPTPRRATIVNAPDCVAARVGGRALPHTRTRGLNVGRTSRVRLSNGDTATVE